MSEVDILRTEKISKRFGGLQALSRVDVGLKTGEIVGLIGPNGSGKTTLFNCICGFHFPEEGQVFIKEENCTRLPPHKVAQRGISRTFQLAKLFYNLPVVENVLLARHLTRTAGFFSSLIKSKAFQAEEKTAKNEALGLLELVNLADVPDQIARDLPYGSQRLLTLAIALSSNPEIILLDEPTAGMNQREAATLGNILKRINRRKITIFLVEHNMRFIMNLSQRIIVLNHGEVICEGDPDSVRNDARVVDAYLGKRFSCTSQ
jgi:branched-chain amino acid transport system ATP-binding protein